MHPPYTQHRRHPAAAAAAAAAAGTKRDDFVTAGTGYKARGTTLITAGAVATGAFRHDLT